MEFNNYFEKCQDDDVLCYRKEQLFKMGKFKNAMVTAFRGAIPNKLKEELERQKINIRAFRENSNGSLYENNYVWFEEGVEFQILRAGSEGWQKGKMKINVTLEFCPDEPEEDKSESPLDDIRKAINQ